MAVYLEVVPERMKANGQTKDVDYEIFVCNTRDEIRDVFDAEVRKWNQPFDRNFMEWATSECVQGVIAHYLGCAWSGYNPHRAAMSGVIDGFRYKIGEYRPGKHTAFTV